MEQENGFRSFNITSGAFGDTLLGSRDSIGGDSGGSGIHGNSNGCGSHGSIVY